MPSAQLQRPLEQVGIQQCDVFGLAEALDTLDVGVAARYHAVAAVDLKWPWR